ncbi:hypothetical protein H5410_030838, partial [Solanum commersonii]
KSTGYKKLNLELSYGKRIKKTHFQLREDELISSNCAAEDRTATLVEMVDELGDLPFNQLIAFSVLPSASSYFESLVGFAYWNKERCMSIRRPTKLDSAIRRLSFLVLFSLFWSVLHLSVHASSKISNT